MYLNTLRMYFFKLVMEVMHFNGSSLIPHVPPLKAGHKEYFPTVFCPEYWCLAYAATTV